MKGEYPVINPGLPGHWTGLKFKFSFRGVDFNVEITTGEVLISADADGNEKIKVNLCGNEIGLSPGKQGSINYK